jgi:photosystem II PsbY protein
MRAIHKSLLGGSVTMDWRLLVVLLPVILAGSWAIYNIGQIALKQELDSGQLAFHPADRTLAPRIN